MDGLPGQKKPNFNRPRHRRPPCPRLPINFFDDLDSGLGRTFTCHAQNINVHHLAKMGLHPWWGLFTRPHQYHLRGGPGIVCHLRYSCRRTDFFHSTGLFDHRNSHTRKHSGKIGFEFCPTKWFQCPRPHTHVLVHHGRTGKSDIECGRRHHCHHCHPRHPSVIVRRVPVVVAVAVRDPTLCGQTRRRCSIDCPQRHTRRPTRNGTCANDEKHLQCIFPDVVPETPLHFPQ